MRLSITWQAASYTAAIVVMAMPAATVAGNTTSTQQPGLALVHSHVARAQHPAGDAVPSAREAVTDTSTEGTEAVGLNYPNWISHMGLTSVDA